jgi:PAS domain S-box-containing protein
MAAQAAIQGTDIPLVFAYAGLEGTGLVDSVRPAATHCPRCGECGRQLYPRKIQDTGIGGEAQRSGLRPPKAQTKVLQILLGQELAFRHLVLLDLQHQELAKASRLSLRSWKNFKDRFADTLSAQTIAGNRYISSVFVDPVTSEPLVIMAVPVMNILREIKGLMAVELNLKFMWDLVDRLEIGETGQAYVVDSGGHLIAFGDTGRVLRGEKLVHLKDGRAVERQSYPLIREGQASGRVWFFRDITELKQAEKTLEMFRFTMDQASDAVFWMNQEAGFSYVNEQTCRSLGYARKELEQLHLTDIDPVYPLEHFIENWAAIKKESPIVTRRTETMHKRKDGTVFPVEVQSKHIWFEDTRLHVAFVRDISERKRAQDELQSLRNYLSNIIDSMPSALVGVDTDGRITQWNKTVAQTTGIDPKAARGIPRMLETIYSSGQRVSNIVDNMLSFARKSETRTTYHYLDEILDKTLELAAADYDLKKKYDFKRIKIVKEYAEDLPAVPCHGIKIQQVLLNIFGNGAQAMQASDTESPQ